MVQRRDIVVAIILSIVTCGIYGLYWFVCLTDDVNRLAGRGDGTSGGMALVFTLITCGIYGYYWAYKMGTSLDEVNSQRGFIPSNRGIVYLVLFIFGLGIVSYALMQDEINKLADCVE